jgi:fructoselysine-6-P-deglycase FrlB-like protein
VWFRVSDVFLPTAGEVFGAPGTDDHVEGVVVSFSDSGSQPRVFAVVDVIRRQTVVVPVERLRPLSQGSA